MTAKERATSTHTGYAVRLIAFKPVVAGISAPSLLNLIAPPPENSRVSIRRISISLITSRVWTRGA